MILKNIKKSQLFSRRKYRPGLGASKIILNARSLNLFVLLVLVVGLISFNIYGNAKAQTNGGVGTVSANGNMKVTNVISANKFPGGIAISPDGKSAYLGISNLYQSAGSFQKLDLSSNTATNISSYGSMLPNGVAFSKDGSLYAAALAWTGVFRVDGGTSNQSGKNVGGCPVLGATLNPTCDTGYIALAPNGNFGYMVGVATYSDPRALWKFTTNTNMANSTITRSPLSFDSKLYHSYQSSIAISPDSSFVYVTDGSKVYRIDPNTNNSTATITVGNEPDSIVFSPVVSDNLAYIYNAASKTISKINTRDNSVINTFAIPGITGFSNYNTYNNMVTSSDGKYLYLTSSVDKKIFQISTTDGSVADSIDLGDTIASIQISPDNSFLLVANLSSSGKVYKISLKPSAPPTSNCLIDTLPGGINYESGSASGDLGQPNQGNCAKSTGTLNWDVADTTQPFTVTYKAKIDPNYCATHSSGPIDPNSVILVGSDGSTIAGPATDQNSLAPIVIKCQLNVNGDVGGGNISSNQILMNGPAVVVSSGSSLPSNIAPTNVKSFTNYDLTNLNNQITQAASAFNSLVGQASTFNVSSYRLNPNNTPGGGVVVVDCNVAGSCAAGNVFKVMRPFDGSGTLIVKNGSVEIDSGFTTQSGQSVGIVVLNGDINVNLGSVTIQNVGLFAPNGKINLNTGSSLNWTGFMVSKSIAINSSGGTISWSGKLAQNPLPGFKGLLNAISVNEVAPQ